MQNSVTILNVVKNNQEKFKSYLGEIKNRKRKTIRLISFNNFCRLLPVQEILVIFEAFVLVLIT